MNPQCHTTPTPFSTDIVPFSFDDQQVRLITDQNGNPWFVAADVCRVLEIGNSRDATSRLDEDEKNTVVLTDGNRGNPNQTIISESGLYSLVLRSDKPQAKPFRKWVTSEVLPSIRKTGGYSLNPTPPTQTVPLVEYTRNTRVAKWQVDHQYFNVFPIAPVGWLSEHNCSNCQNSKLVGGIFGCCHPDHVPKDGRPVHVGNMAWCKMHRFDYGRKGR